MMYIEYCIIQMYVHVVFKNEINYDDYIITNKWKQAPFIVNVVQITN